MAKRLKKVEIRRPTYSMSTVNYQHGTLSSIAPAPLASKAKYEDETAVCGGNLYLATIFHPRFYITHTAP